MTIQTHIISESMLSVYIGNMVGYSFLHYTVPKDFSLHDPGIDSAQWQAEFFGDEELLRLGLEYILTHPEYKMTDYNFGDFSMEEEEIREVLAYAHRRLWPQYEPIPEGGPPNIKLVSMQWPDWRKYWDGLRGVETPSLQKPREKK